MSRFCGTVKRLDTLKKNSLPSDREVRGTLDRSLARIDEGTAHRRGKNPHRLHFSFTPSTPPSPLLPKALPASIAEPPYPNSDQKLDYEAFKKVWRCSKDLREQLGTEGLLQFGAGCPSPSMAVWSARRA